MNTLTKHFARRAISILLVTIMVFSLGIIGITSASAAEVEMVETGFGDGNNVKIWWYYSDSPNNASSATMSWNGTSKEWTYTITGVSTSKTLRFDFQSLDKTSEYAHASPYNYSFTPGYQTNLCCDYTHYSDSTIDWMINLTNPNVTKFQTVDVKVTIKNNGGQKVYVYLQNGQGSTVVAPDAPSKVVAAIRGTYSGKGTETEPYLIVPGEAFTIDFTATHSDPDVSFSYILMKDNIARSLTSDDNTWTYEGTAPAVGTKTKIYADNVFAKKNDTSSAKSVDSNVIWVQGYKYELTADIKIGKLVYNEGENVVFSVEGNEGQSGSTPTYTLITNGVESATQDSKTFVITSPEPGEYKYKVRVEAGEHTYTTSEITVNVIPATKDNLNLTVNAQNVNPGSKINILASVNTELDVEYSLYDSEGNETTTYEGDFHIPTSAADAGLTKEFTVKAVVTTISGETITLIEDIQISINEISTTTKVRIYFKSSDSLGYKPTINVRDVNSSRAFDNMQKGDVIAVNGTSQLNPSQTSYYRWYYYDAQITEELDTITFQITNKYELDVSYTIENAYDNPVRDNDGNIAFYFGAESLNNSVEVQDLTTREEAERNWTFNAVNMVYDAGVDGAAEELLATTYNYRMISMGDTNGDGKVNVRDATLLQKNLAKMADLTTEGTMVADVNSDDKITVKDVTAIQKQLAGL